MTWKLLSFWCLFNFCIALYFIAPCLNEIFFFMWRKLIFISKALHSRTCFETEAKSNSEIVPASYAVCTVHSICLFLFLQTSSDEEDLAVFSRSNVPLPKSPSGQEIMSPDSGLSLRSGHTASTSTLSDHNQVSIVPIPLVTPWKVYTFGYACKVWVYT